MKIILSTAYLLILSASCFAENQSNGQKVNISNPENEPVFNIELGMSPFAVLTGFEYQKGHNGFGYSPRKRFSYRYYYKPGQETKFWGVYLGSSTRNRIDTNEYYSLNDVNYDKIKSSFFGAGIGYSWQWVSGWNTSVSIALEYTHNEYSISDTSQREDDYEVFPFPGVNVGYKF